MFDQSGLQHKMSPLEGNCFNDTFKYSEIDFGECFLS